MTVYILQMYRLGNINVICLARTLRWLISQERTVCIDSTLMSNIILSRLTRVSMTVYIFVYPPLVFTASLGNTMESVSISGRNHSNKRVSCEFKTQRLSSFVSPCFNVHFDGFRETKKTLCQHTGPSLSPKERKPL